MASPMAETADIVIIGSGIAGLAAGCYAQMNGYRTHILEAQNSPGGLCTALSRQGYVLDGGLHYIFGTSPGQPFYSMWEELGAVQGLEFVNQTLFMQVQRHEGEALNVYSNPDELEAHLKALSPQDAKLIEQFCNGVRTFKAFDLSMLQQKPKALMTGADWAKVGRRVLPFVRSLGKWGSLSLRDLGTQFKHPFLQTAVPQMFSWPDVPVMVGMSLLAYLDNGNAGFPVGGSLRFAEAIAQRYLDLGGTIEYGCPVEQVMVDGDRAIGVRLTNQQTYLASRVISACDGRHTLFHLLQGKYLNHRLEKLYTGKLPVHSQFQMSLGLNRDLSVQPHWVTHLLDQPLTLAGAEHREVGVKHYSFDPSLAPAGKSVMMAMVTTPYVHWQNTYGEQPIATTNLPEVQTVLDCLDTLYPGLANDVEVMEVSTPLSLEQRSGNWQGASSGWLLTKETLPLMIKGVPKRLPGLEAFYMAGQWTEPGGSLPIVALSGRNIIYEICHEDGRDFIPQRPA